MASPNNLTLKESLAAKEYLEKHVGKPATWQKLIRGLRRESGVVATETNLKHVAKECEIELTISRTRRRAGPRNVNDSFTRDAELAKILRRIGLHLGVLSHDDTSILNAIVARRTPDDDGDDDDDDSNSASTLPFGS